MDQIPLIEFDSNEWKDNAEYLDVANEILKFIEVNDFQYYFIQNKSYILGDTESNPIIMVNKDDYGGISGTMDLFVKDIVYDLIPNEEEEE
jgi:hypothetical protein